MTMHHRHHSAVDMGFGQTQEPEEFNSFPRNTLMRASTGNLKQPRLPGSEKFKFARSGGKPVTSSVRASTLPPGRKSQMINSCTGATLLSSYTFSNSKRKPILPISRNTSRVLNNTNVELTADTVEIVNNVDNRVAANCQKYHGDGFAEQDSTSDEWSRSSSDQSLERDGRYRHTLIIPHQRSVVERINPNSNHHETNNNNHIQQFATIRSNRLHTRTPRILSSSASQSTISSDDDIWVMRS